MSEAAGKAISPDPARSFRPAEVYRRVEAPGARAHYQFPRKPCAKCKAEFTPSGPASRYCDACKSSDSPKKVAATAIAPIASNTSGAAAPVQPSGRKRPAKEAARDRKAKGAAGRVAQPAAPPPSTAPGSLAVDVPLNTALLIRLLRAAADRLEQLEAGGSE